MHKQILVLSSDRAKCGVKDYTKKLLAYLPEKTKEKLVEKPINLKNLITAPFDKYQIIHIQHEFFLFDKAVGVSFLPMLLYLGILRLVFGYKIFLTIHSVYNPDQVTLIFDHFKKYSFSFPLLKIYLKFYYKFCLFTADQVITLSHSGKKVLDQINQSKQDISKVSVVPIGVYPIDKKPQTNGLLASKFGISENYKVFTLFGFAFHIKGYHFAIKAMAVLKERFGARLPYKLIVVSGDFNEPKPGEITYLQSLKNLTKELNLENQVLFTGFLPDSDPLLIDIFARTHSFIFPYYNRHIASAAVASVLDLHKPLITSDMDYFKEYSITKRFEPENVIALADLINEIAEYSNYNQLVQEVIDFCKTEYINLQALKQDDLYKKNFQN